MVVKSNRNRMDEAILVCIYYGPNGERLIRRGSVIAKTFNCPFYILTVDPQPVDELEVEKSGYLTKWKKLADELNADGFILKDNDKRPTYKVIAEIVRQKRITQIIIGQTAQSRWEQMTKESIINQLLREIPFVDLHIISVSRYIKDPHSNYEKGVRSYLIQENDYYRLAFKYCKDIVYEGIFFKEIGTDFNNGIFKFMKENETLLVDVVEDIVYDLCCVELAPYRGENNNT